MMNIFLSKIHMHHETVEILHNFPCLPIMKIETLILAES